MKVRKLILSAFGPYGKTVELDFAKNLDKDNMFVIAGNTGAGKTTIFDGINFALYGEASGKGREAKGLRSNFATEDEETFVDLTFTLKGNEYRVKRNPEYLRKKKSGEGFTTTKPNATLDINGGKAFENGETITGHGKVTEAIKDILGINSEQFKQLVMIPQGEFKRLLEAKSEEKEKIFRKIFGTNIISNFQDSLREKANKIKNNSEKLRDYRCIRAKDFILKEGSSAKPLLEVKEINVDLILEMFFDELEADKLLFAEKESLKKEKDNERLSLLEEHNKVKAINELISEKIKTEIKLKTLLQGENEHNKRVIEKTLGDKAFTVSIKEDILNKVLNTLNEGEKKLTSLELDKKVLEEKEDKALKDFEKAQVEALKIKDIDKELDSLKELKEKTGLYEEKAKELRTFEKSLEESKDLILTLESEKLKLKESIQKINDYLEMCSRAKDKKLEAEKEKNEIITLDRELQKLLKDIDGALNIETKLKIKNKEYLDGKKLVDHREKLYKEAEDKLFRSQAGILALELEEGNECPVCGSTKHPKKAILEDTDITKEAVDKLKKAYEDVNKAFVELKTEITSLKENYDEREKELKEVSKEILKCKEMSLEEYKTLGVKKCVELAENGVQVLNTLKKIAEVLNKEEAMKNRLEVNNKALEAKEIALDKNKENINSISIKLTETKKDVLEIEKLFNGEIKSLEELLSRENVLNKEKEALEKALNIAKEMLDLLKSKLHNVLGNIQGEKLRIEELKKEVMEAKIIFNEELLNNDFKDEIDYKASKKSKNELMELGLLIENYNKELNSLKTLLKTQSKSVEGKEKGDLDGILTKGKAVKAIIDTLDMEIKKLVSRIDGNAKVIEDIKKINKDMEKDDKEFRLVGEVSKLVNGENSRKITLERYILAAHLDDILKAANKRLLKMTNDRYRLLRKKEIGDKRSGQGLDLQVFDVYSNKERDVSSLSGGEGFKASLAMALGLSDVVQNSSGGIQLDTMFIDEGFGTLDQESLESAIDILAELQGGGRMVGVISHVAELKERIPKKIIVSGDKDGSTAKFI